MKKSVLIALGLIVGLGLAQAVPAAENPRTTHGKISAIDVIARTITIKMGNAEDLFTLADTAKITAGGKSIGLDALTTGERVKIEFTKVGEVRTATRVEVIKAAKPQPQPTATPTAKPAAQTPAQPPKKK